MPGSTAPALRWRTDLPGTVRVLQAGLVLNAFGNGAAAPFLLLYLHTVRGIPLPLAGLASAVGAACALGATLVAGGLGDRYGQRPVMLGGLVLSTVAYSAYPFVEQAAAAVALAALAGCGIGTWLTMQSGLLAALTPVPVRHLAFAAQRVAANVGLGLGGFVGGLLVTTSRPATFTALFWLDAATFTGYALVLTAVRVPPRQRRPPAERHRYRDVLADPALRRFAVVNLVLVTGAVSLLNGLFPVYAKGRAGVAEPTIGALFLLNSVLIVAAQVRVARAVEGALRLRALALAALLFAVAWLGLAGAGTLPGAATRLALLVFMVVAFSAAECLYDAVQGPLVADLAPPERLSRYLAVLAFAWQFGFILGPALGAVVLSRYPTGLWLLAAAVCLAGGWSAMRLDRTLPERVRRTPTRGTVTVE